MSQDKGARQMLASPFLPCQPKRGVLVLEYTLPSAGAWGIHHFRTGGTYLIFPPGRPFCPRRKTYGSEAYGSLGSSLLGGATLRAPARCSDLLGRSESGGRGAEKAFSAVWKDRVVWVWVS